MVAVGIDVSKGKSTVAAVALGGDILIQPADYPHTVDELNALVHTIRSLPGEVRVVMESTGRYHEPVLIKLLQAGIFTCVVNPLLTKGYDNNSLRKVKTDKHDAMKLANYGLEKWDLLKASFPVDSVYGSLKDLNRQLTQYEKISTAAQLNLLSLLDAVYPGVKGLFNRSARKDGRVKWMDFLLTFWHCECVSRMKPEAYYEKYRKWCKKNGYNFSQEKAVEIHNHARQCVPSKVMNESVKIMIIGAAQSLINLQETTTALKDEMYRLAATLPEFDTVMAMHGVGPVVGPQLLAEIGNMRRFANKRKLVAYAGIDSPPFSSGKFESSNRHMTKRGSSHLRKTLFIVMTVILANKRESDSVYQFMDKKRSEGKHYLVYNMAGARKFLHILYARVMGFFAELEQEDGTQEQQLSAS